MTNAQLCKEYRARRRAGKPAKQVAKSSTERVREWRAKRRSFNKCPQADQLSTNATTSTEEASTVLSTSREAECFAAPAPSRAPEYFNVASVVKQESSIGNSNVEAYLCSGKQEFIDIELTPVDGQKCAQATSTPADAGSVNVDQDICVKDEIQDTDLDIGPTVLQPMDSCYRTNQETSVVKTENTTDYDDNDPTLCHLVNTESVEDKCGGHEIQNKWRHIRDKFRRELKEQKSGTSGRGAKEKRTYLHIDELLFLIPQISDNVPSSNNINSPTSQSQQSKAKISAQSIDTPGQTTPAQQYMRSTTLKTKKHALEEEVINMLRKKKQRRV